MSSRILQRALLLLAVTAAFAASAQAQAPTAEDVDITNTASVTYNDGGTGSYTASGSVTVKVGFKAAVTVGTDETQIPASPSTANSYTFTVTNGGNGVDTVSVGFVPSTGITITQYSFGGNDYTTFAAFDAAIKLQQLDRNGGTGSNTVDITIEYSVATALGGDTLTIVATATSVRSSDPAYTMPVATGDVTLTITPAAVAVTPDGDPLSRAPGSYSETFQVFNNAPSSITYILSAGASGDGTSSGAISGTGVSTVSGTQQVTIAAGATASIDVAYTVSNSSTVSPGDVGTLTLTASSTGTGTPSISDSGSVVVTVLRPLIVVTKEAYMADDVTLIDSTMTVKPGDVIRYRITVANTGNTGAQDVDVTDVIPTQVTWDYSMMSDATNPTVIADAPAMKPAWDLSSSVAGTVIGKLIALADGDSRTITIIVTVK
jgi:uncharacterized repeat protein (TIGR01451 family)